MTANTVWITGAAGFIGQHLVRHLATSQANVAGLDLVPEPASLSGLLDSWEAAPLSEAALDALDRRTGPPQTIYHLAGGSAVGPSFADPVGDFTASVAGTVQVLDWLRRRAPQCRLVLVSSAAVYGNLHHGAIAEDATTAPYSPYGTHKFAMEQIARGWAGSFGLNVVAARLFSVYGKGLRKQLLWDLCGRLADDCVPVRLGGTGAELRDWTHVDDIVRALALLPALATPAMPSINAGTGTGTSVAHVAGAVATAFGRDALDITFSGDCRPGDPFSLIAAPGQLRELGFTWSRKLEDGIDEYVDWYRRECKT